MTPTKKAPAAASNGERQTPAQIKKAEAAAKKVRAEQARVARERRQLALGNAIRITRMERELTQTDLGNLLTEPLPQTTVSRWEKGLVDLTAHDLAAVEDALELKRGTFAVSLGLYDPDFSDSDVFDLLLATPSLHPDLRQDAVRMLRSYIDVSKKLFASEETPKAKK